jgi:uncharacterized protein with PIN domain
MKIEFGKCPYCEKEVMKMEKSGDSEIPVRLPGYSTFWIALSDGSKMQVAVCEDCRATLTDQMVEDIMVAHREAWTASIQQNYEQNFNYYASLKPIKHALRERDLE